MAALAMSAFCGRLGSKPRRMALKTSMARNWTGQGIVGFVVEEIGDGLGGGNLVLGPNRPPSSMTLTIPSSPKASPRASGSGL